VRVLNFRTPGGRETLYPNRSFRFQNSLPETASEDEAAYTMDLSRRFIDDDCRRVGRGLAIGLSCGILLWGVIALCIWFFW
jgi:hypothetical protein